MHPSRLLVTGGAGFIGSSFIRYGLSHVPGVARIVNLDLLTYAADLRNLSAVEQDPRYLFVKGDICDEGLIEMDAAIAGFANRSIRRRKATSGAFE